MIGVLRIGRTCFMCVFIYVIFCLSVILTINFILNYTTVDVRVYVIGGPLKITQ